MGHESPERAPEQRAGHAPALDTRSIAAPAVENQTLDALAERAIKKPDPAAAAALRPQAVQRLQLRAGNAAVAAMLQRRAAPTVRRPAPPARKPPTATPTPVSRLGAPATGPATDTAAPSSESAAKEQPSAERANVSTIGIGLAGAAPPSPEGLPIQRSLASMIEEARRRAAPPAGPDDTKTVEGDTDLSEFTDAPAKAAEERKAIPPPPAPPLPATPGAVASASVPKPPPKPPKKRVGKALVAGPKPKPKSGGPGRRGAPKPGEVVKKPAPPLPPVHVKNTKPGATVPPPPAPPKPIKPGQDPAFAKVVTAAKMTVKKAKKHPNGKAESAAAQGAAVPPGSDIEYQAKANRIDTMATAKPKPFDEEAFVAAVADAMRKSAPKNLSEAGDVDSKSAGVKDVIGKKVAAGKEAAGGDVEAKAEQPPDPSTATPKPVTPMEPLKIEEPGGMKASGAMPAPAPNAQVDFRHGPAKVDSEMADAGVSEQQLAESNEPEFTGALDAKKEGEEHAKEAPAQVRQAEAQILKQATVASAAEEKKAVSEANSTIGSTIAKVGGQKDTTKSKDELKRKEVADHINSLFDKTKADVEGILSGLETTVDDLFTSGEAAIRKSFTEDWNKRLNAYKDDRYSGLRGPFRWARDKLKGLPAKANQLFEQSKAVYERDMQKLVRRIAQTVSAELNKATVRIEQGRGEVAAYVGSLKGDLAKFGQEAAADINDKFDNLDSSVKDKFDDLAGSLAKKYSESQEAVAAEIEAAQEANKGLIAKAVDAVKGVIKVISQLKDMILNVLSRIASVVGDIIAHPIKFLKNFVAAVKGGITRFMDRIGEHLQKGLMGWLFGTLDAKGIEIPDSFSLEGIMKLVMSVLGMTWDFVKQRLAKKIGEPAMNALIAGADIVKKVVTGGPGVLWEMIVEKFTEFQDMVVGEIKNFVIEKVVKSGITFLISLLNPAAAFIKACKMIYDVVMFFVERGSQIKEFVDSLIDAAGDVAKGGGGGIPEKIEGVLAKVLPLAISFLASLLGLGGVGDKVRSIIDKVRNPIHRAMDKVIDVVLRMTAPIWKPAKKLFEKGKKLYGKAKDKAKALYEKGKDKVKQTYEAGKAKVKDLYGKGKKKVVAGAKAAKDAAIGLFKRREQGFAMHGAPHRLIAEPEGDTVHVYMQSRKERLTSKLSTAIGKLSGRAAQETDPDKKSRTERLITRLKELLPRASALEDKAEKGHRARVTPTGAPPGFDREMKEIADDLAKAGNDAKVVDILAAPEGTQVDPQMLGRFGMPLASYLQAQQAADDLDATIDIRPTNVQAPDLLSKGNLPKSKDFKEKTINEADLELGVPKRFLGKMAWFNPTEVPATPPTGADPKAWAKIYDRFKYRRDEYLSGLQDMPQRLAEGEFTLIEVGEGGGVVIDALKKVAYTGDHDLYDVRPRGREQAVIDALEKPPFRVQHGAHLMWPMLPEVLAKGGLTPHERMIYEDIVRKHGPGGEALLRVQPHDVPVTGNARPLPPIPPHEQGKERAEIFKAEPVALGAEEEGPARYLTPQGRLLNGNQAVVPPQKVFDYVLNPEKSKGKTALFNKFGFTQDNGQALLGMLMVGARTEEATEGKTDQHGTRFTLMIPIGGGVKMTTGWIYGPGSNIPRLTTLFIKGL